jgi:hypothetical protein
MPTESPAAKRTRRHSKKDSDSDSPMEIQANKHDNGVRFASMSSIIIICEESDTDFEGDPVVDIDMGNDLASSVSSWQAFFEKNDMIANNE